MRNDRIYCPHCKTACSPTDDENCDIWYTTMECEHCDKKFAMSRTVTVEYTTWEWEKK